MGDEDSVRSICWGSLSALNCEAFATTKKYPCKFEYCKRSFAHSQSRSRHYRQDHSSNMPQQKGLITNNYIMCKTGGYSNRDSSMPSINASQPINRLSERNCTNYFDEQSTQIRATPQIKEVINLCQSFFNRENTKTAIAMIKGSRMVQDNAIEMR